MRSLNEMIVTSRLFLSRGYFGKYSDWPLRERKAMKYARGRILDIGCGARRLSLCLQRKGFDVVGVEISRSAIRVCKLRGLGRQGSCLSLS